MDQNVEVSKNNEGPRDSPHRRCAKNILPSIFSEGVLRGFCIDPHSHLLDLNLTMAAVYKTVSKKRARQPVEEPEDDMEVEMQELLNDPDDTTDSEEDEEEEDRIAAAKKQLAAGFMPKTRVLILTSRGVNHR